MSLLQPRIIRGDIEHNLEAIRGLSSEGKGDLLVLPEYALTGSLVLDLEPMSVTGHAEVQRPMAPVTVPTGKHLLVNALYEFDGKLRNCCHLLPTGDFQCKMFPDQPELDAGILPGTEQKVFELSGKRFKIVICSDRRCVPGARGARGACREPAEGSPLVFCSSPTYCSLGLIAAEARELQPMEKIPTNGLDFILFVYHFTERNFSRVMQEVKSASEARGLPTRAHPKFVGQLSWVNDTLWPTPAPD